MVELNLFIKCISYELSNMDNYEKILIMFDTSLYTQFNYQNKLTHSPLFAMSNSIKHISRIYLNI
jgi:hypothetical protein